MKTSISKRALSIFLAVLMCLSCISVGIVSANAAYELYLRGTFNDWNTLDDYKMETADGTIYTKTIVLAPGNYQYKVATSDWGFQFNDNGGDISLTVSGTGEKYVTFTADTSTMKVTVTTEFTDELDVILRCAWDQHANAVLVQEDDTLTFHDYSTDDMSQLDHKWNVTKATEEESVYIQNTATEEYLAVADGAFVFTAEPFAWDYTLTNGNIAFKYEGKSINIEDWQNGVALTEVPADYTSAHWRFFRPLNYSIDANGVYGTAGYKATADSSTSITTNASGSSKTWTQSVNTSAYPTLTAADSPLLEAVYNLSMEEFIKNQYDDPQVGTALKTGDLWNKVWTRDSAYSNLLAFSWIDPEISDNCNRKKVHTDTESGVAVFEQDTGTGGSYPNSTDKIILLTSVWETYLSDGNTENLEYFYTVAYNTMMQDLHVAMDPATGLMKGETGGIDWRDQTYPDWMGSRWNSGMVDIAEGRSAVVNATYVRAYEIMARMADILGKGQEAIDFWTTAATTLEEAMSTQLWHDDLGIYASWMYPEYMGSPLSYKGDIQGNGYALWFDVGTDEQIQSILDNYPLVNYGAPTTYPQKMGKGEHAQRYYHNRGIWPGWQTIMMVGAKLQGNEEMAEEIFDSNIHCAAAYLSNYEVVNYETGEGIHSAKQLWSVAGTLAGYYRLIFGMNYTEDGITFAPTVQDWVKGEVALNNYKYRDATLNITVNGTGDNVTSFKVNGEDKNISEFVIPTDATGTYNIEITVEGNVDTDTFKQGEKYLEIVPTMPTMTLNGNTLSWTPVSGLTYYLWTGSEAIDVTGETSYEIDPTVYGSYSLYSVTSGGLESELSEPIIVSPTRIKLEAEEGSLKSTSYIKKTRSGYSGSGYVMDNLGNSSELQVLVDVPTSGKYLMHGIYNNIGAGQDGLSCAIRSVYVDGEDVGTMVFPEVYGDYTWQESSHIALNLSAGKHIIKVVYDTTNPYDQNMAWYVQFDIASDVQDYVSGLQFKNSIELDYLLLDLVEECEVDKEALPEDTTLPTTPVGPEYTYTVAGTANLCGAEWDPTAVENDMTSLGNGLFEKVYENLSKGTYQFKIVRDYSWDVCYGYAGTDTNISVTTTKEGATLTITFDQNTLRPTYKLEYPVDPTSEPSESTKPTETQKPTETEPTSTEPSETVTTPTETEPTQPTETEPTQPVTKAPTMKLKASSLKSGKTTTATVSNANGKKVTYTSSNPKVATINKTSGKITALAKGKVTITAKVGTQKITKKLTVTTNPQIKKGKKVVNKGTFTIKKGQKLTLTITGKAASIKNKIAYTKKNIVKTTTKLTQSKVTFKGNKKGTTKVTITINNVKKYTYTIKVK